MRRRLARPATVLMTVAALTTLAAPPSAAVVHTGTITGGTFYSGIIPAIEIPLVNACSQGIVTFNITGSIPNRTSAVTSNGFATLPFVYGGNDYVMALFIDAPSPNGSVTGSSSPYNVTQQITLFGEIHRDTDDDCLGDVFVCELELTVALTGTTTGFANGDKTNLSGSNTPVIGACGSPFTTLNSSNAGLRNLQVTF